MRISIIGLPGSGKSTLAEKISSALSILHIEIDRFWFEAGGMEINYKIPGKELDELRETIRQKVIEAMQTDSWVADGVYPRVQPLIASAADQVVFLKIPLWQRLYNHAIRMLNPGKRHKEVGFWDDFRFFAEIIRREFTAKPRLLSIVTDFQSKVIILRSREEIELYFLNLFKTNPARSTYMQEQIKIIDAIPDDAVGITDVFYKTWLATYPNEEKGVTVDDIEDSYKDEFSPEKIENLKKLIRDLPENKKRLVAKIGNMIVGACTLVKNEDNNHLRTLYILPEFQNKGIGTMFWNEAVKFFDPKKDTVVQVADYTENAIAFYKKLGFVDTGKRGAQESGKLKSGAIIMDMEMVIRAKK